MARTLLIALASLSLTLASVHHARALPEIWLAPLPPTLRADGSRGGVSDYYDLFGASKSWQEAAKGIKVFKLYPEVVRDATDAQLKSIFSGLAHRHIALALETPVLADSISCGLGGARLRWMVSLVAKIHRLGGHLKSVAMVGPLVDGHTSTKSPSCGLPILDVAKDAAKTVVAMRALYPALEVGEIEPLGDGPGYPDWSELYQWLAAFKQASGQPLSFFHLDVEWGHKWEGGLKTIATQLRAAHIKLGLIYNGAAADLSDKAFSDDVLDHADQIETSLGTIPDQVIIQSWENYPRRALPDLDPTTMTGVVQQYTRPATKITLNDNLKGRITSENGEPLSKAVIYFDERQTSQNVPFEHSSIAGNAPHTATQMLVGVRSHIECKCSKQAIDVNIRDLTLLQFKNETAPKPRSTPFEEVKLAPIHSIAAANEPLIYNGSKFSVRADTPFRLTFDWQVPSEAQGAGAIVVIFFGDSGAELTRTALPFKTTWRVAGSTVSTADGSFAYICKTFRSPTLERLRFEGDHRSRPTALIPACKSPIPARPHSL